MQKINYEIQIPPINLSQEGTSVSGLISSLFNNCLSSCFMGENFAYSPLVTGVSLMDRLKLKIDCWETTNPDFMLQALKIYGLEAMGRCSPKLLVNQDFILQAIDIVGVKAIQKINKGLRSNPDFMLLAMKEKGIETLSYASKDLLSNPSFMLDVVNEVTKAAETEQELDEHLAFVHKTAGKSLQKATSDAFRNFQSHL